jgi:hypothetical protein
MVRRAVDPENENTGYMGDNMIQTLPLTNIATKWETTLAADDDLADFCETTFGKALSVFVGYNIKKPPTEADCPYIVIIPGHKTEGPQIEDYVYAIPVGWCIVGTVYDADAMGQLIIQAVAECGDVPIFKYDYTLDCITFLPQILGHASIEIEIPVTYGREITY